MADLSKWTNSKTNTTYNLKDSTARASIAALEEQVLYDRQAALGVYAGRNLQTVLGVNDFNSVVSTLHSRIASNNFAGLRIGDYMNVSCGVYGTQRFDIAHINPYYQMGSTSMGKHICFVNNAPINLPSSDDYYVGSGCVCWNTTNNNNGTEAEPSPYMASNLKAWENVFLAAMPSALTQYLIDRWEYIETRYASGQTLTASTGRAWKQIGKVWSLSEMEVYGCVAQGTPMHSIGIDRQLDYFRNIHNQIPSRTGWWLRVATGSSSAGACDVVNTGVAYANSCSTASVHPRLGFLLG